MQKHHDRLKTVTNALAAIIKGEAQSSVTIVNAEIATLIVYLNNTCTDILIALDNPAVRNNEQTVLQLNEQHKKLSDLQIDFEQQTLENFVITQQTKAIS